MIHNFSNICCFTFILFTNLIFVVVSLRDCLPLLINSRPVRIIVNQYEARAASHHHRLQSLVSQYVDMAKRNASVVHIEYGSASPKIGDYNITASLVLAVTDSSSNSSDDCVNNGPILPSNNLLQAKQCFKIEYIIQDINECITGLHRCHSSAPLCIKVPGTYHCACDTAGGDFGVEGSGRAVDVARTWSVPKESRCRSDATASSRWQAKGVFELVLDGVKRWMSRGEDAKGEEAEKVNGRGCGGEKTSTKCCEKICRGELESVRKEVCVTGLLPPPSSKCVTFSSFCWFSHDDSALICFMFSQLPRKYSQWTNNTHQSCFRHLFHFLIVSKRAKLTFSAATTLAKQSMVIPIFAQSKNNTVQKPSCSQHLVSHPHHPFFVTMRFTCCLPVLNSTSP